jgi:hypothetical protein
MYSEREIKSARNRAITDKLYDIERGSAHEQTLKYANADSSTTADLCIFRGGMYGYPS